MALRVIRLLGDEILTKPCREVKEITPRLMELIDDMMETMYDANGVGLSAPQVGVLRRIAVIDVGLEEPDPFIFVNPVITRREGEQTGDEGCLSFPGKVGTVTRPLEVTVRYCDEHMDEYELDAGGLLARAICHEVDHLEGHMYVELVEGEIRDAGSEEDEDEFYEDEFDDVEFEDEFEGGPDDGFDRGPDDDEYKDEIDADELDEEFDGEFDEEFLDMIDDEALAELEAFIDGTIDEWDEGLEDPEDEFYEEEEPAYTRSEPRLIRRHDEPGAGAEE